MTLTRRPVDGVEGMPALDRLTPEERATFVRWITEVALAAALDDLRRESPEGSSGNPEPSERHRFASPLSP